MSASSGGNDDPVQNNDSILGLRILKPSFTEVSIGDQISIDILPLSNVAAGEEICY